MAYDYTDDVAFARQEIAEYGRPVTLLKQPSGAADPNNPLAGPSGAVESVPTVAAFVYPTGLTNLGMGTVSVELFKHCDAIALIANIDGHDVSEFDQLDDGDRTYAIDEVKTFKPGDTVLLYYVGVRTP